TPRWSWSRAAKRGTSTGARRRSPPGATAPPARRAGRGTGTARRRRPPPRSPGGARGAASPLPRVEVVGHGEVEVRRAGLVHVLGRLHVHPPAARGGEHRGVRGQPGERLGELAD